MSKKNKKLQQLNRRAKLLKLGIGELSGETYTVVKGDSLTGIINKHLGQPQRSLWTKDNEILLAMVRALIGANSPKFTVDKLLYHRDWGSMSDCGAECETHPFGRDTEYRQKGRRRPRKKS